MKSLARLTPRSYARNLINALILVARHEGISLRPETKAAFRRFFRACSEISPPERAAPRPARSPSGPK